MKNKYYMLLGLGLWDGCIHNPKKHKGSKLAYLDIAHHIKNGDYVEWKARLISELGYNCKIGNKHTKTTKFKKVYTKGYYILEQIRLKLYKNGKKIFKKKWSSKLEAIHLAIMWMDDGCYVRQRQRTRQGKSYIYNCGEIATQGFGKESNENILLWLSNFGIQGRLYYNKKRNHYYIKLNRENLYKLVEVIRPYVNEIPSMAYKLGY